MTEVVQSECAKYLDSLEPNQFDSCVTDPPYDIGLMNKKWDRSGIACDPEFWRKVKRVLKPGAHMAVFGGSETYHRMAVGIEDAGFELRENLMWVYAEGFAKSHDVSKAIDKHFGKKDEREVVGFKNNAAKKDGSMVDRKSYGGDWVDNPSTWQERGRDPYERAPATSEAKKWNGWDTQLKPAKEPIVIARKPFEGTVAENVLEHGTGALNIDECRVEMPDDDEIRVGYEGGPGNALERWTRDWMDDEKQWEGYKDRAVDKANDSGRWPANVIFDPVTAKHLDKQSGVDASRYFKQISYHVEDNPGFFYCPKAKRNERNLGADNDHVTVKPIELVSYLVRLLNPKEGHTLDPFAGSGTTGMSAVLEGCEATLVETNEHYAEIAKQRVRYTKTNYQSLREDIYGDPSNNITNEQTEVNEHNFW